MEEDSYIGVDAANKKISFSFATYFTGDPTLELVASYLTTTSTKFCSSAEGGYILINLAA